MRNNGMRQTSLRFMLRRNAALGVLNFLVIFFSLPFWGFVNMPDYAQPLREGVLNDVEKNMTRLVNMEGVRFNAETMAVIFGALGFFSALVLFAHLFSRRRAMMTAALPVTRRGDFCTRLLCVLVLLMGPLVLNLLLYLLSISISGLWAFALPAVLLPRLASLALIALYGFALGALCAVLAGQYWSAVLLGGVFAASGEGLALLTEQIARHYLRTLPGKTVMTALKRFSPAVTLYKGWVAPHKFVWWPGVAAILLCLLLGLWLYQKRKTEAAEKTLAFEKLANALEVYLGVLGAAVCGYLFSTIFGSETGLVAGLVLGAAACHILCRMIFSLSLSHPLAHWPLALAGLLIALLGFGGIRQDVLGYDRFMPEASRLTAVTLTPSYMDCDNQPITCTSPEAVQAALNWAAVMRAETANVPHGYEELPNDSGVRRVEYNLNGRTVKRWYGADDKAASMPYILSLVGSEDFQNSYVDERLLPAMEDGGLSLDAMFVNLLSDAESMERFGYAGYFNSYRMSAEKKQAILEAYWQDVRARTAEQMQAPLIFKLSAYGSVQGALPYQETYINRSLPVYATDTNVLRALFGDKADAVTDYAQGGFILEGNLRAVRQTFDADCDNYFSESPISSEVIVGPEEILACFATSYNDDYAECYYLKPVDACTRIYLFDEQSVMEESGLRAEEIDYETLPQGGRGSWQMVLRPVL